MQVRPIPLSAHSWGFRPSLAGIAGLNPSGGKDICLLRVLCFVRQTSLRLADHPSRGVLTNVMFQGVIVKPRQRGLPGAVEPWKKKSGKKEGGMAQSVQRLATGCLVQGSYPEVGKGLLFSRNHLIFFQTGTVVFPGHKQLKHEVSQSPPFRAEVKNE